MIRRERAKEGGGGGGGEGWNTNCACCWEKERVGEAEGVARKKRGRGGIQRSGEEGEGGKGRIPAFPAHLSKQR